MSKVKIGLQSNPVCGSRFSDGQWPKGTKEKSVRDALARELISVCMAALRNYGLTNKGLTKLARDVAAESRPKLRYAAKLLTEAQRLAETLNKWGEDPTYLDESGRPAVLKVRGEQSFATLAKEFFPRKDVNEVIGLGCRANVIERVGVQKVARLNNFVLFTGNSVLQLAHSVRTVRCFLNTADFNKGVSADAVVGRPDRAAHVAVTEGDFSEFVAVIRPQISGLVEMSNRWLCERNLRKGRDSDNTGKKRVAGIQVFVFRE